MPRRVHCRCFRLPPLGRLEWRASRSNVNTAPARGLPHRNQLGGRQPRHRRKADIHLGNVVLGDACGRDRRHRRSSARCNRPVPAGGRARGHEKCAAHRLLRLLSVGSLDKLGSLVGRPPIYITASAAPGEFGAISSADAIAGLTPITRPEGTGWHNRVAARSLLGIGAHRPSGRQPTSVARS